MTDTSQGWTRAELREEVAQRFGLRTAAATGGSTSTIVDSRLARYADNYFNGWSAFIKTDAGGMGASPEGQASTVVDFVSSTGTLTVSPTFTVGVAAGDVYQLYRYVAKEDIDNALAHSSAGSQQKALLTASITTLDYDLNAIQGLRDETQVMSVWVRRFGQVIRQPFQVQGYTVEDAGGLLTLRLPYRLNPADQLWIIWALGEHSLTDDADRVNMPMDLIVARTMVHLLNNMLFSQDETGLNKWGLLLRQWQDKLKAAERAYQIPAGKVRRHPWEGDGPVDRARYALKRVPDF